MEYEVAQIGDGWQGTGDTVEKIRQLVNDALLDPKVVRTARLITQHVRERDKDGEIRAVSGFIRTKIRYVHEGVETLSTPRLMLDDIEKHGRATGDCDEFVTLWLALLRALGHHVRVRTISQRSDKLANHIFGEVYSPTRGWISDDAIVKNKPLGWRAGKTTKEKTYEMSGLGGLAGLGCDCNGKAATMNGLEIPIGRTRVMRSDQMCPQKKMMRSRSLAPSQFTMTRTNEMGLDFSSMFSSLTPILTSAIETGGKVIGTKYTTEAQKRIAALGLPGLTLPGGTLPASMPAPAAGGGSGMLMLGLAALAFLMFMKR